MLLEQESSQTGCCANKRVLIDLWPNVLTLAMCGGAPPGHLYYRSIVDRYP
jgi:hypothetical protein